MVTLLDILLRRVIRHGSLTLIDADGIAHRYGDGSSPSVSLRLKDKRLERQLVVDPELALGEAYMYGRLEMIEGRIYDFLELFLANLENDAMPGWTRSFSAARYLSRRHRAIQSVGALASERGAPLRHRRRHLRPVPRFRPAILLRLLHGGRRPRGGAARQEAPPRGQARHRAGTARARHRLGLGRARALSRQGRPLRRDRRDAQQRAAQDLARARGQGGPEPRRALRVRGLPQGRGPASTASCRSACSSTSASTTTRPTSASCATCSPTTAWR